MTGHRRNPAKRAGRWRSRIRRALGRWYPAVSVTVVVVAVGLSIFLDGRPIADLVAWLLGAVGQLICLWCFSIARARWTVAADHEHKLRVLLMQASAAILVGTIAQSFWGVAVVGLPVVVSLVAVVTLRDGMEALALLIRIRGEQEDPRDGDAERSEAHGAEAESQPAAQSVEPAAP